MTAQDDIDRIIDEIQILQKVSVEHTGRITSLETRPTNDDCVGCCKVVDVAANLQKELDECSNMNSFLNEDIEGLKADYGIMRTNHRNTVAKLQDDIRGIEAELSARKEDSDVLMKVVGMIRAWNISPIEPRGTINDIRNVVKDYLDAPEGPETPIDDLYRTTVSVFLEMP